MNYFERIFKNIDSNIKLDKEQIKAIKTDTKYEMIIAGAGSGKTTTMAGKIKYLVDKKKIKPEEILIISYTNEAVKELREKILYGFKIKANIVTFHKLCLDLLKQKYKKIKILSNNKIIFQKYFDNNKKYYSKYLFYNNKLNYIKYKINKKINAIDIELIYTFINIFKSEGYKEFKFLKNQNKRILSFILLVEDIYKYYVDYLNKNKIIDFDFMINKCIEELDNLKFNYKYLIIDEYQDISNIRFQLIKKIDKLFKPKIIVVGDDFQSIYSFSGSDLELFVDFENKIGKTKLLKITNTYRNSQELIDIIGKFVMKNPKQIKKQLKGIKHLKNPVVLEPYNNKIKKLKQILNKIENNNILLLGRYKHDINFILKDKEFKKEKNKIIYKNLNISFLTVHQSKGLGFDNVIVLNNKNGIYGFPSKIKDHKYLNLLKRKKEKYPYAEERRLFYVALTRTKNKVYLMYPKNNPSIFIKEIKKYV